MYKDREFRLKHSIAYNKIRYKSGLCKNCGRKKHSKHWNCYKCRKGVLNDYRKRRRDSIRYLVLKYYSKGDIKCVCCKERRIEFLTINHINGGGNKQYKKLNRRGNAFYEWLKQNNFPKGFNIMCMNCNWASGRYGYCPHNKEFLAKEIFGEEHKHE